MFDGLKSKGLGYFLILKLYEVRLNWEWFICWKDIEKY